MGNGSFNRNDIYLFHEGTLYESYRMMGAHVCSSDGLKGARFTVWAPHAREVYVLGDFNSWNRDGALLERLNNEGIWTIFVPGASDGDYYKYEIVAADGRSIFKADPYAYYSEKRPGTASRITDLKGYKWYDGEWMAAREERSPFYEAMLIYEVHLGTWKKKERHNLDAFYTYRELADELVDYVAEMGYTHIELMPLAEHPFDRSWGYQATGYYSVTSRFGTPKDFMYFVDCCHRKGLGVIMDWVPGHFCKDDHGLRQFDGQPLYEYEDPRKAEKVEWGTLTFDFGKPEVRSFLISNALFWMDVYHIDGIRVDAVASMLYLNMGKPHDLHITNDYGGNDDPYAISMLKQLNKAVFQYYPRALMMAEDSSDWPLVTAPVHDGGLGFNYKWNMGWMNDMLRYMKMDSIHRQWHHNLITFSFMYTFSENYVLPLSHDEVVHGKRSLMHKMPGDYWQKFGNLRVFYGYHMGHPGKKLLFMGGEFGQFDEWKDLEELDWFLLDYESHSQTHRYVKSLNWFYRKEPALWELDHSPDGFKWINPHDNTQSVVVFERKGKKREDDLIVICNFTPVVHGDYRIGVPQSGIYEEVFNSDLAEYGGTGLSNKEELISVPKEWHGLTDSLSLLVPPLATIFLKRQINLDQD
jgi:1,4-alpha-glucan branching enzyme